MTEIGTGEQEYRDFDWFCVDDAGEVGHFTTAGYKRLPRSVARSAEDLKLMAKFFESELGGRLGYRPDPDLAKKMLPPHCHSERYLHDFVAMADKGLYSFDIETYLKPNICYFRVAMPTSPIKLPELPIHIQEVLKMTQLKGRLLRESARILYEDTLSI